MQILLPFSEACSQVRIRAMASKHSDNTVRDLPWPIPADFTVDGMDRLNRRALQMPIQLEINQPWSLRQRETFRDDMADTVSTAYLQRRCECEQVCHADYPGRRLTSP